ncbi:MAG: competence/damage-inducible protein A [Microthrixaceae bacterium]
MRTEVVAIGTELLLGQIHDTNSAWIGEQLALVGIDSLFQTKVGDNLERIIETLHLALSRSDAVICCGGLGPTQDDITRSAIAQVMGVSLEADEEMEQRIAAMFESRGRRMPSNNLSQAMRPIGAEFIAEQPGTAPGLLCPLKWSEATGELSDKVIYAVPGVPWEMKEMVSGTILPDLQKRAGISAVIGSRTLRTWGESESALAEMLHQRIIDLDSAGNPTLAFLASGMEGLKVRITAKGETQSAVQASLAEEEVVVRQLLGDLVFGVDDDTMESVVLQMLASRDLTLGVAESLTGGMIGSRISAIPGASKVFLGSIVSYASEVKFKLLDVPTGPVVSESAALAMALGAQKVLGSDVGISATGVAGPESAEGLKPGTVCVAVVIGDPSTDGSAFTQQLHLPGGRTQVREFTVITLLAMLRHELIRLSAVPVHTDQPTTPLLWSTAAKSVWSKAGKATQTEKIQDDGTDQQSSS